MTNDFTGKAFHSKSLDTQAHTHTATHANGSAVTVVGWGRGVNAAPANPPRTTVATRTRPQTPPKYVWQNGRQVRVHKKPTHKHTE